MKLTFNPFMLLLAAVNLAAGIWYLGHHKLLLTALVVCYAAASVILAFL